MKLDYRRTVLVGLAFMSICTFWQVYDAIVPLILKDSFHVNDALAGAVMAADNVLALFLLPLFGMLSDRSRTRLGRRMPFILFGTLSSAALALLLPVADNMRSLPFFIVALGLVLVAMASYRSPAVALMPDVTPKPLRSRGNAVINLMGAVGGMLSLLLIAVLVPKENPDYTYLFASVSLIMALCLFVLFRTTREPELAQKARAESLALGVDDDESDAPEAEGRHAAARRLSAGERRSLIFILASVFLWFFGYNAVTTAFSKYARHFWGLEGGIFAYTLLVAQGAAIVSFLPMGALASKIGRRRTILLGVALLTLAFAAAALFSQFSVAILGFFAVAGVAWAAINVNSYPMVVELCRGGNVGRYTGYYYTFSMLAQVITPILSGALLQYVSYRTLFPYGALFVGLSFVTMLFVRHGDSRPEAAKSRLDAYAELD